MRGRSSLLEQPKFLPYSPSATFGLMSVRPGGQAKPEQMQRQEAHFDESAAGRRGPHGVTRLRVGHGGSGLPACAVHG